MHLPFNFFLAQGTCARRYVIQAGGRRRGRCLRQSLADAVLNNHDIARACDRFGHTDDGDAVAKLLATMLLTLRGTPFMYDGEEIAMRTHEPSAPEDVRDLVGNIFWPLYKGRDGARRPMQWDRVPGGGFTHGTPWLPLSPDALQRNVGAQAADSTAVLSFYRALIRLRRTCTALQRGQYRTVRSHPDVFAYVRQSSSQEVVMALTWAHMRGGGPGRPQRL